MRRTSQNRARVGVVVLTLLVPILALGPQQAVAAVPEPRFGPERKHPGVTGRTLAMADFTGDGRIDVATTVGWSQDPTLAYKLYVHAQTADGRLELRSRIPTSQSGELRADGGLAAADFDADGRADLAVPTGIGLDIFLQADGTLVRRSVIDLAGARQVEAADVDGDGRLDLVVVGTAGVSLLRGAGAGAFTSPVSVSDQDQVEIDVGDVTGDGRPDIVGFTNFVGNLQRPVLHVFRQLDAGGFAPERNYATTGGSLALGDFTGDGRGDVAQTIGGNRPSSALSVFPQRADGSLGPAVYYPAFDVPEPLEAADVNGDGRMDLVTLHDGWLAAGVFVQQENGTMAAEHLFGTTYGSYDVNSLAVGDLSGDGLPDLVYVGTGDIAVLPGLPPGPPATTSTTATSSTTSTTRPPASTTTTTTAVPVPTGGQTTAFQIDAAHTGSLRGGPERPPLTKRWSVDLGGTISFPLIADGTVFAIANTPHSLFQSTLYALDAATGRTVWGPIDLGRLATYTYGAGQIFVVNSDGLVRAFDARTGRMRWITDMVRQRTFDASPVYRDGVVYFAGLGEGGSLYALSADDGHELWMAHIGGAHYSSPAAGDGVVYTSHGCAAAWRATTGALNWFVSECGAAGVTPALSDGLLWARGVGSRLPGAFDVRTGERVVTFTADEAPAFDGTDGFFLTDGVLEAREARTQTTRWSFAGDGGLSSAPIVVNGFVYAASTSGQVWALDSATGEVAWTDNAGAPVLPAGEMLGISGRPATGLGAGQGVVVVPASNLLVAYAPQGSTPASATPVPPPPPSSKAARPTPATDAGHFRIDPSNRGWAAGGPGAPPLQERWSRELGAAAEYAVSGAGKIFVGAGTRLLGLDPATGKDAWPPVTFPSTYGVNEYLRVAYGDGRVFAVLREGSVRAIDAATGRELWFTKLDGRSQSGPIYSQGIVYLAAEDRTIALSASTGRKLWETVGTSYRSPPAVSADMVYPAQGCWGAADALTGVPAWPGPRQYYCEMPVAGTPVVAGGRLWQEGEVARTPLVRDATSGAVIGAFGGTVPALDGSRAYVVDGSAVKAKDPVTQFTLWTFAPADRPASPPVVLDGYVYVTSRSGRVWALDPATGAPVWWTDTGETLAWPFIGPNLTVAPGLLLVPAGHGLRAYGAAPAPPPASTQPPHPAAFGWNPFGETGDGTTLLRTSPVDSTLTDVVEVSAGAYHTLSRRADGSVWTSGWNALGQLGDGTTTSRAEPVQVQGLRDVVAVSAGVFHSLAVTADGSVWSWGWNALGQLGDGTTTDRTTPTKVTGLAGVATVSGGIAHSVALGRDGRVLTWGWNVVGQLGLGTRTDRLRPAVVPGLTGVTSVAAGWYQTIALKSDGTVWGWGSNAVGQLGDGTTVDRLSPVQAPAAANVVAVSAGVYHSLAVHDDGTVSAWGWNGFGSLGDGTRVGRLVPVKVPGVRGVTAVSAGAFHSLARRTDGTVLAWGWNNGGQLGDGTMKDRDTAAPVPSIAGATSVAAGAFHSVVLRAT